MECIDRLVKELNEATVQYDKGTSIMSDKEWDDKYFDLMDLEKAYGYIRPDSPTQTIAYQSVNELKKVTHSYPMLSLAKTKEPEKVMDFLDGEVGIMSLKMDGVSLSLTYDNGRLVGAETRGDGKIGEDVLHNALVIPSIPKRIKYDEKIIINGELICTYKDFEPFAKEYKNPRNFVAGSIRLLSSKECAERKLSFIAWELIKPYGLQETYGDNLYQLKTLGFKTVPFTDCQFDNSPHENNLHFQRKVERLKEDAEVFGYPVDGIVCKFDSRTIGESKGATAHHKNDAIAYKFYDEEYETRLDHIEFEPSRNGVLTPIAVFEPIEIEGTTVSRSTCHNWSTMINVLGSNPYKGQKLWICKKNQIIPYIIRAEKDEDKKTETALPPMKCPKCGEDLKIKTLNSSDALYCSNSECGGAALNKIVHYCSKSGMDIRGLSKATIEKLMDYGWVKNISDIYILGTHKSDWINKRGFGKVSVTRILKSIEDSKECKLSSFISALGIPLIGKNVAFDLASEVKTYKDFREKINNNFDFSSYANFGEAMDHEIKHYDYTFADEIANLLTFLEEKDEEPAAAINPHLLSGLTIVITGKLNNFKNREELKRIIENFGGKVGSSISSKTSLLINNDLTSNSSKNKKAKELGISIINEKTFIEDYLTK